MRGDASASPLFFGRDVKLACLLSLLISGCATICERNGCDLHPRECRRELAILDEERRHCPGEFSYELGCLCQGKPC
jgi:hypothetical protein